MFPERGFMVVPIDGGPVKFMTYHEYIVSPEWQTRVTEYKADSGWECEQCANTSSLTGHHLTYRNIGNEPREDICILCSPCHELEHTGGQS
jgi:hypothetical protein